MLKVRAKRYLYAMVMTFNVFVIVILLLQIGINVARADEEPQIIDIKVIEEPVPEAIPDTRPVEVDYDHELNEDDVELLQRFLWMSPLTGEHEKKALLWLVFNRIYSRDPEFSTMTSVKTTCTKTEFGFMDTTHDHRSETNYRIVTETWNEYLSWRDGKNIGPHPSQWAVYCSWYGDGNHGIHLYDKNWKLLEW